MPAMPKVARQTLPKNRTAPRTLNEQCGVRSMWVAVSNTAATIPATLLAYSSTYELICGFFRPWRHGLRHGARPGGYDGQRTFMEAARKGFDIRVHERHFHRHLV